MVIGRIHIENFKKFRSFNLNFNEELNVFVGNNETGKSTLLEAIHLALTGTLNGRNVAYEISPHIFNKEAVAEYLLSLKTGSRREPPAILIELYLIESPDVTVFKGRMNSKKEDTYGLRIEITYDDTYNTEYADYIRAPETVSGLPTEYYKAGWFSFANAQITARSVPATVDFIDAATIKLQSGADAYVKSALESYLGEKEKTELRVAYRRLKEKFEEEPSLKQINERLKVSAQNITERELTVSLDLSHKASWEANLTPFLDGVPFGYIGKGEQSTIKVLLALEEHDNSNIVLIEEPENHLSFARMNAVIKKIREKCEKKQLFITTHSTFVSNKLGLDNLILLGPDESSATLANLSPETQNYFKRLPGYDTLRMILAERSILVEGPSDELIVQKAYLNKHKCLPIEHGVDVLSLRALSFKRYLEIAMLLGKRVSTVMDNDGKPKENIEERYSAYFGKPNISICYSRDSALPTREDHMARENSVDVLNRVLETTCTSQAELAAYMKVNKTLVALLVFETKEAVQFPSYINDAVEK